MQGQQDVASRDSEREPPLFAAGSEQQHGDNGKHDARNRPFFYLAEANRQIKKPEGKEKVKEQ